MSRLHAADAPHSPITLRLLSVAELQLLADGGNPEAFGAALPGSLPPVHVAKRALQLEARGQAPIWTRTYWIVRSADQTVVGGCGFKGAPVDGRVEIGYAIAAAARRSGFATAAVLSLLELAFAHAEVDAVLAEVAVDNLASTALVTKLGFDRGEIRIDLDGEVLVPWWLRRSGWRAQARNSPTG